MSNLTNCKASNQSHIIIIIIKKSNLDSAKHFILDVTTTKLFFQCGPCSSIEHFMSHLRVTENKQTKILLQC